MKIQKCRICQSSKLTNLFSLGKLSFTGKFPSKKQNIKKAPIELILCQTCKLVQLAHNFDLKYLYGPDYGYRTGINKTMLNHVKNVVKILSKKVLLKNKNSLINLPYLHLYKDKDEILISHSTTILSFLGKEFGMFGQDRKEELQCEQLLQETDDLRKVITSFAYIHHKIKEDEIISAKEVFNKAFEKTNVGKIQKFEHWFSSKNKTNKNIFLVGNKISSPDFNLFDILDLYVEFIKHYKFLDDPIDENIFEKLGYPYVSKFYNNFKILPKMQKYLNSQLYKLPYTNKSANFGSGIKGNTWDHKNQIDETPTELIIS